MLVLLPLLLSCDRAPTAQSLLLITVDTCRADRLGAYGYAAAETPTIDQLAAQGTLYERAYTVVPETLPAHTSMMTGLYPPSHAVRLNLVFKVPSEIETLAEILRDRDFYTAAYVSATVLDERYGLDQGFLDYEDPGEAGRPRQERRAQEVTARALTSLRQIGERRFFLWVHYYDPHSPFDPPPPFRKSPDLPPESPELYDGEIAYMDHWIGRLLEGLRKGGHLEDTLVILAGDHGESLGDHGETYHTLFIYDATIRTPLILSGPEVPAGQREQAAVSTVDVFATALEYLGIEPPETSSRILPGLPVTGKSSGDNRWIYSDSMTPPLRYGWNALESLRTQDWLYIRAPEEELYRLDGSDPEQKVNLSYSERRQLAEMRELLEQAFEAMPQLGLEEEAGHNPSEDQRRALEALGYLGSSGGGERPVGEGTDPKDMVEVAEAFQMANLAIRLGQLETAQELLEWVVEADPENYGGWIKLSEHLLGQGSFGNASEAARAALSIRSGSWEAQLAVALAQEGLGEFKPAQEHFSEALASCPFPAEAWRRLGQVRLRIEEWDRAAEAYRELLQLRPRDPRAQAVLRQLAAQGLIEPQQAPTGLPETIESED